MTWRACSCRRRTRLRSRPRCGACSMIPRSGSRLGAAARTRAHRDYAIATMADRYERLYRGEALESR